MLRKIMISFLLLLVVSFFIVEGDVNANDFSDSSDEVTVSDESSGATSLDLNKAETVYTKYFFIALGVGTFAVLLVLYIVYLFIRGPNNKWKKPKPLKQ